MAFELGEGRKEGRRKERREGMEWEEKRENRIGRWGKMDNFPVKC